MLTDFEADKTFTKVTAADIAGKNRAFENCRFVSCDFSNADFSGMLFMECVFETCNLSLAKLVDTGLQDIRFKDCKLSGADFGKCRDFLFGVNFEGCILDNAVFYKKKNKGAKFTGCSLVGADFTEADLTDAQFDNCNFSRAFFDRTILRNVDMSTSYNFIIDPDNNDIKKAKFSLHGLQGLLAKYDIKVV
jgi:fluoroquinolone resistance protein